MTCAQTVRWPGGEGAAVYEARERVTYYERARGCGGEGKQSPQGNVLVHSVTGPDAGTLARAPRSVLARGGRDTSCGFLLILVWIKWKVTLRGLPVFLLPRPEPS